MGRSRWWIGLVTVALVGCASQPSTPRQPPGTPPTPATVTAKNPGGDSSDPEAAALQRLLAEPFGTKLDFWRTLRVPLADQGHWRRVRLWGHPTRATFRYGDDHYAVATIWYTQAKNGSGAKECLQQFLDSAMPLARTFDVSLLDTHVLQASQRKGNKLEPMLIELTDARVGSVLVHEDYAAAIAAYPSWPDTCLVQGFAVQSGEHRDLARKVRDRWVNEAAPLLAWDRRVKKAPATQSR